GPVGVSEEDFYQALATALDDLRGQALHELPAPLDIQISLRSKSRRLGDFATLAVTLASGKVVHPFRIAAERPSPLRFQSDCDCTCGCHIGVTTGQQNRANG